MVTPGVSRAVTMGVLGFLAGALLVIVFRALQSLDPVWAVGPGIVFGTIFAAIFFVWGIGGFDPRMSAHGEDHEHDAAHDPAAHPVEAEAAPGAILSHSLWQIAALLLLLIVALAIGGQLGPTLRTVAEAEGSVTGVANVPLIIELGITTLNFGEVSELTIFVAFVIFMLISLAIAAWLFGFLMTFLSTGISEGRAAAASAGMADVQPIRWLPAIITFVVLFIILYFLHYYVLVGLIFPSMALSYVFGSVSQLALISFMAAFGLTLIIVAIIFARGQSVRLVSRFARWLAVLLRGGNRVDGTQKPQQRNRP